VELAVYLGLAGLTVAVVAVVVLRAHCGSEAVQVRRGLRRAPRVAISDLVEGTTARLAGTVVTCGNTLAAPLSGRECVYYEAYVVPEPSGRSVRGDPTRPDGLPVGNWAPEVRVHEGVEFLIDDGTGRVVVDPSGARVALVVDHRVFVSSVDRTTGRQRAFLDSLATARSDLRVSEACITPGLRICVLGQAMREPDPDAVAAVQGYRDELPTRMRMRGGGRLPLIIGDERELRD